jgi:hypothetical protein
MALSGKLQEVCVTKDDDNEVVRTQYFNFSDLSIQDLKIEEEDRIALVYEKLLSSPKDIFSFKHFYQLLSCCVRNKKRVNWTP